MSTRPETLCPSAQPDWDEARLFAVVGGTPDRPETAYLDQVQPVSQEVLDLAGPVTPTEVFRIAAPCAHGACGHYDEGGQTCRLAQKIVRLAPVVFHVPQTAPLRHPAIVPVVAAGRRLGMPALPAGGDRQLRADGSDAGSGGHHPARAASGC